MVKTAAPDVKGFSDTAKSLSRNPLGIIALFIVLVYGFASLITAFSTSFEPQQKTLLVYFLVFFPVLVLAAFLWLVSRPFAYGPSDFKNDANYLEFVKIQKMQLSAVASLAVASTRREGESSVPQIGDVVEAVQRILPLDSESPAWNTRILWVDDRPENNVYERGAFEAVGLTIRTALSTIEALEILEKDRYAAVISDMGRKEGPREGYVLLDRLRANGDHTPFFIYAGSNSEAHKREAAQHGGQGSTNNPQELFETVTKSVLGTRSLRRGDFMFHAARP